MTLNMGVDFGACYSYPAFVNGNEPQSLLADDNLRGIPSVAFYSQTDKRLVYGEEADKRAYESGFAL